MIEIQNLTININNPLSESTQSLSSQSKVIVRDELVNTLRIISEDARFLGQTVVIPDSCEQYGFAQGTFDLPTLLHFLADMLEE